MTRKAKRDAASVTRAELGPDASVRPTKRDKKTDEDATYTNVLDTLRDPVTFETMTRPHTLPCGHTFDKSTIDRIVNKRCTPTCPTCRQEFRAVNVKQNVAMTNLYQGEVYPKLCGAEKFTSHLTDVKSSFEYHQPLDFESTQGDFDIFETPRSSPDHSHSGSPRHSPE